MISPTSTAHRVKVAGDLFHGQVPPGVVYVGRGAPGLPRSPYANPHSGSKRGCLLCGRRVHTHAEGVTLYRLHLMAHPELVASIRRDLPGRTVACWCRLDDVCHGDVILAVARGEHPLNTTPDNA